MSAATPVQTQSDPQGARDASTEAPREPSMEEILTSIRRLIAQDQSLFAADLPSASGVETTEGPADGQDQGVAPINGLRQAIEAEFGAPRAGAARGGDAAPDKAAPRDKEAGGPSLASPDTDASVAAAFTALVASRFARDPDAILAMTRDALRPLLQDWLDAHLPALVERLVSAEIQRIAKGA